MEKLELVRATQYDLKWKLVDELTQCGYEPVMQDGFLYGAGSVPVLLVAHLDTVHKIQPEHVWESIDGTTWKADEGIGGDDRCGVYALLKIMRRHKVHVLFCEDEEIGCIGARKFAKSEIKPDVNFIIEFDRKGANDAVFYDCDNMYFIDYICKFGFQEDFGSFSDISVIAPALGVAAVNLSSGYYLAHTNDEYIVWPELERNIEIVCGMLEGELQRFEYIERVNKFNPYLWGDWNKYGGYYGNGDTYSYDSGYYADLMPFDGMVSFPDGTVEESCADDMLYMIDASGFVYGCEEYDTYIMLPDATARNSETGLPVKYDDSMSIICYVEE